MSIVDRILVYEKGLVIDNKHPDSITMSPKTYSDLMQEVKDKKTIDIKSADKGYLQSFVFNLKVLVSKSVPEGKIVFNWGETPLGIFSIDIDKIKEKMGRFTRKRMIRLERS